MFELVQDVIKQQPQIKHLAWTAIEEHTSQPQFYLTRFSNYSTTATTAKKTASTTSTSIPPLLYGVGVSPGIRAEVVVVDFNSDRDPIPHRAILVTKAIAPQHLALIKRAGGIITETGGKTSHGAIIARELHIPAIVNVADATKVLQTGDRVLLDGDSGNVYPAKVQLESPEPKSDRYRDYPIATKLMVNLSQPESIASASSLRVDGVGLLRSELMLADLLNNSTFAWWQESFQQQFITTLTNSLRQFTTAFAPRPVFYRSLDRYAKNLNSVLGSRGTYDYISDPTLFDLELQALNTITTQGHHNLNLILPFVRSVEEFQFCDRRIENAGLIDRIN